jgi:hypothetical protein
MVSRPADRSPGGGDSGNGPPGATVSVSRRLVAVSSARAGMAGTARLARSAFATPWCRSAFERGGDGRRLPVPQLGRLHPKRPRPSPSPRAGLRMASPVTVRQCAGAYLSRMGPRTCRRLKAGPVAARCGKPSDAHAPEPRFSAILPPCNARNRFQTAPDGALWVRNFVVAGLQPRSGRRGRRFKSGPPDQVRAYLTRRQMLCRHKTGDR